MNIFRLTSLIGGLRPSRPDRRRGRIWWGDGGDDLSPGPTAGEGHFPLRPLLSGEGRESVAAFDAPWLTPRRILPTLHLGDFDGDGTEELLALTYTGSGTGVSVWTPVLFEPSSEGWEAFTLPYEPYSGLSPLLSCQRADGESCALLFLGDSMCSLELEDYVEPQAPLEPYVGPIVSYGVEGSSITVKLGVGLYQEGVIPYTLSYVAELRGEIVWDGQGFSLCSPLLGDFSD